MDVAASTFLAFVRVVLLPSHSWASTESPEAAASILLALVRVRVLPSSSLLEELLLLVVVPAGSSSDESDFCFLRLVLVEQSAGLPPSLSSDTEAAAAGLPSALAGDSLELVVVSDDVSCKKQTDNTSAKSPIECFHSKALPSQFVNDTPGVLENPELPHKKRKKKVKNSKP